MYQSGPKLLQSHFALLRLVAYAVIKNIILKFSFKMHKYKNFPININERSDFVEFCDEKYFTNGKKCIIMYTEVNS